MKKNVHVTVLFVSLGIIGSLVSNPALAGSSAPVTVVNTTASPVPVLQQGPVAVTRAGQPVRIRFGTDSGWRVPTGKRLSVTYISLDGVTDNSYGTCPLNHLNAIIETRRGDKDSGWLYFASYLFPLSPIPGGGTRTYYVGGGQVDLVFDPLEVIAIVPREVRFKECFSTLIGLGGTITGKAY